MAETPKAQNQQIYTTPPPDGVTIQQYHSCNKHTIIVLPTSSSTTLAAARPSIQHQGLSCHETRFGTHPHCCLCHLLCSGNTAQRVARICRCLPVRPFVSKARHHGSICRTLHTCDRHNDGHCNRPCPGHPANLHYVTASSALRDQAAQEAFGTSPALMCKTDTALTCTTDPAARNSWHMVLK